MAYAGGYPYGYQDGTQYLFTPTTAGHSIAVSKESYGGEANGGLWRHYGKPVKVQATIIYTSGTSSLTRTAGQDTYDAADAGSGKGGKMIYPTPTTPSYPITETEALAIIADDTYADFVSQE